MGSMLIAAGLGEGDIPERWNIDRPDDISAIHKAYLEAGAEVIQTNSFGGNRIKMSASAAGRDMDTAAANEKAAILARKAVDDYGEAGRFVAGDMGPTGEFFAPMGKLAAADAREAFREQAAALDRGGVDLFLVETMYDMREAIEALRGVKEVSDKPVIVELTFARKPRGYFTLVGDTPERAAEALPPEGAEMIGANCTISSGDMVPLAGRFRSLTETPLLFQPNAGLPEIDDGKTFYRQEPRDFASDMMKIVEAGANAVGGCCGTDPRFIAAVRAALSGAGR
jgi:5-methyltetrahydrofolate--homocysteine methyltransferase